MWLVVHPLAFATPYSEVPVGHRLPELLRFISMLEKIEGLQNSHPGGRTHYLCNTQSHIMLWCHLGVIFGGGGGGRFWLFLPCVRLSHAIVLFSSLEPGGLPEQTSQSCPLWSHA